MLDTSGESSGGLQQKIYEVHKALVGIQRTVEMLAANQMRNDQGQEQVQREAENNHGHVSNPVVQGMENNAGSQLLKNFMAL